MDLQEVLRRLKDIDREARSYIHPVRGDASALEGVRALIADVEDAIGREEPDPAFRAMAMEVGEIRRVGVDGHLTREDEDTWLYTTSVFATEHSLDAAEVDGVIGGVRTRTQEPSEAWPAAQKEDPHVPFRDHRAHGDGHHGPR